MQIDSVTRSTLDFRFLGKLTVTWVGPALDLSANARSVVQGEYREKAHSVMGDGFSKDYTADRDIAEKDHSDHLATLSKTDLLKTSERIAHKPAHIIIDCSYKDCLETVKKNLLGVLAGAQLLEDVVDGFCEVYMSVVREIFHGEMQVMERRKGLRTCSQSKTSGGFRYHFIITARYQYLTVNSVYETRSDGQRARDYAKSTLKLYVCSYVDVRRQRVGNN